VDMVLGQLGVKTVIYLLVLIKSVLH